MHDVARGPDGFCWDCRPAAAGELAELERERVLAVDVRAELERVGWLATEALEALEQEAEGDFRRDVLELHTRAATLLHLVATW